MGSAIAEECIQEKISILLGPGVNIKRSPLGGRNFEYFLEDPFLSGELGTAFVQGVQSKGIGTSLKHYAANNQETRRNSVNVITDERTLREIYLLPFEIIVKNAHPWTIMAAYNQINGEFCTENEWLLNKVLREEWNFDGIVMTDWFASVNRVKGVIHGNDLEMPSSHGHGAQSIVDAVKNNQLDESLLNKRVGKILELIAKSIPALHQDFKYDKEAHHELAKKIASESIDVLKNNENILPLKT
jgi:beta-glucosidase